MDETFLLTNMAPQVGEGFNRHCKYQVAAFLTRLNDTFCKDWAYVEDWCRRLTGTFAEVYVFTVPLYLPKLDSDGKWRIVNCYPRSFPNALSSSFLTAPRSYWKSTKC
jgi:endonuclease G, mitochondrial